MIVNRARSIFNSYKQTYAPSLAPLKRPERRPCEVVFQPPRKEYQSGKDFDEARKEFREKLDWAEVVININPANDYDAFASTLPLALDAVLRGVPFVIIVPEEKLIPLPYLKELKNLKEASKNIKGIHFFHSDEGGLEAAIDKIIGEKRNIVFVEADFPHTTSSLNSKQSLAFDKADITPDYNLESIYDCLSKRLGDKEFYYLVIDHHSNTSAANRFKNIKNGLFINDPSTGACWLLTQQLMARRFNTLASMLNDIKELHKLGLTKQDLTNLLLIHKRFAFSAIATDFYINGLNGRLNEASREMIKRGKLTFPIVDDLVEIIKRNPHIVNLIWSDRSEIRKIQSLIKGNNLSKLHFLLAKRLHDEGKKIIIGNDGFIERVLSEVVGEYIEEFKASTLSLNEETRWSKIATKLEKLIFLCDENIPKLAQNIIINPLQATINFWSSAFNEAPVAVREVPRNGRFDFIQIAEDYLKLSTTENSKFIIIDEDSYLGELLMKAFLDKDLSLDDLRRIIGRAITNFLKTRPENKRHLTVVIPLGRNIRAIVSKTNGNAPINSQQAIQKITQLIRGANGGGSDNSAVAVLLDENASLQVRVVLEQTYRTSLTAVSQNIPTG